MIEFDEIDFWRDHFEKYAKQGNGYVDKLVDPKSVLNDYLSSLIPMGTAEVKVLDVGCGPLSVLGKVTSGGRSLNITGVDPLANEYREILNQVGIVPPFDLQVGFAERLASQFPSGYFDFVHSRNALDHCEDPYQAIANMLEVAKSETKLFFNVNMNEAENASYTGFHRWNFDIYQNRLLIWNPGRTYFLDEIIGGLPYEFMVKEAPPARKEKVKYPSEIDVLIHKIDNPQAYQNVCPKMSARKFGNRLVLRRTEEEIDFVPMFFIHFMTEHNSMIQARTFKWYPNMEFSCHAIPDSARRIRVGQFYVKGAGSYEQIWASSLMNVEVAEK